MFCYLYTAVFLQYLQNRIAPFPPRPFASELIPQILRSLLIERHSSQDKMLYQEILTLGYIPLSLIAMIATLVCRYLPYLVVASQV